MTQQAELGFEDLEFFKTEKLGTIKCIKSYPDFLKDPEKVLTDITNSWDKSIDLFAEATDQDDKVLRPPQKAAVFSALSHLECSDKPASIVMPTGTGKTETMIALMMLAKCKKVLIIVPSSALLQQTVDKFETLGILPEFKNYNSSAKFPIVGKIKHIPKDISEIDALFDKCNVIVGIAQSLGQSTPSLLKYMAGKTSHLFIDEAHHITANTWKKIKVEFEKKKKNIIQFTATPFRNDDKPIDGKIIFNYSLKDAFENEYFKKINFEGILEWDGDKSDQSIAKKAVEILKDDLADPNQFDHILMARVKTIPRAQKIYDKIYNRDFKEYSPVLIHSDLSPSERKLAIDKIQKRESRIIVCVDMLGEGFDLPNLKIAALHDIHKSLPITLQFTGRFTRVSSDSSIGEAHVIANIAETKVHEKLEQLYSHDSDWNSILQYHSDEKIEEQISFAEFIDSFDKCDEEISLQNIKPKMSTVIYRMESGSSWNPKSFKEKLQKSDGNRIVKYALSSKENALVIIEGCKNSLSWGTFKDLKNLVWDLYLVYWSKEYDLLFIHSSNNGGLHENLAKTIGGNGVQLIKGDMVFRSFHKLNRIILNNVGLNSPWGKAIRYTMYTGIDVEKGLDDIKISTKAKSNIFGVGFEGGEKMSYGCSYKGRIWSRRIGNIKSFVRWCDNVGEKVLNDKLNPDDLILNQSIRTEVALNYPNSIPITIEWDEYVYLGRDRYMKIIGSGGSYGIDQVGIDLCGNEKEETNLFKIYGDGFESVYSLEIVASKDGKGSDYNYELVSGDDIEIQISGRDPVKLSDYFKGNDPLIRFVDGSFLQGNLLCSLRNPIVSTFDSKKITAWDWEAKFKTNIRKESQGKAKNKTSIQYRLIQQLKEEKFAIIFDDDSAGEMADVVAARIIENKIELRLYHCKFSSEDNPGDRLVDLYTVCGQAQRSIQWQSKKHKVFEQLVKRAKTTNVNGFECGNEKLAMQYCKKSKSVYPIEFSIYIVQPGISKSKISKGGLDLLGATMSYLNETYQIPLYVIGSK